MRILLALLLFGCGNEERVDACGEASIGSDPCVTFHLVPEPRLAEALITRIAMWVTTQNSSGVTRNVLVQSDMKAPTPFPIAVGLQLPQGLPVATDVRIETLNGPGPAGYKFTQVMPAAMQHLDLEVMMQHPDISACFNNIFNTGETDLDCGARCTPCDRGRHCIDDGDCKSASCTSNVCD